MLELRTANFSVKLKKKTAEEKNVDFVSILNKRKTKPQINERMNA